jgi:transcriptional regulator GlxA family with amidase domain
MLLTEEPGIYSSAGGTSYWSLLLRLVEKYTDRETAIIASKYFLLDIGKNRQSPFSIFNGRKDHGDKQILEIQEYLEKNYRQKYTVDDIAEKFGITRRSLERKFKKCTYHTLIDYLQRIKIEATKKQLENGRKTVNEVMKEVGYTDVKAFRDLFKKITGLSPIDYRNKFN